MRIMGLLVVGVVAWGCGGKQPPARSGAGVQASDRSVHTWSETTVAPERIKPPPEPEEGCAPLPPGNPWLRGLGPADGHIFGKEAQYHVYLPKDPKYEVLCSLDRECLAEAFAAKSTDECCVDKAACCIRPRPRPRGPDACVAR